MPRRGTWLTVVGLLAIGACGDPEAASDEMGGLTAAEWEKVRTLAPLPALPPDPTNRYADDPMVARFGQRLFFETGYGAPLEVDGPSGKKGESGKVSCATCHDTARWYVDTRSPNHVSHGVSWTPRNSPSLVNVAFYKWYSWAGKQDSLWMQGANGSESKDNFAASRLAYAHLLYKKYRADYDALFPVPLDPALDPASPDAARFPSTGKPKASADVPDGAWEKMAEADRTIVNTIMANCGKAIAAYERRLVSRGHALEKFVAGDRAALGPAARRGLKLFVGKAACDACHKGPTFTDDDFHNTGVLQKVGDNVPEQELGRFDDVARLLSNTFNGEGKFSDDPAAGRMKLAGHMKGLDADKGKFRTKSLLQVGETAPYLHNGSLRTLEEVVSFYNKGGGPSGFPGTKDPKMVPLNLTEAEERDLVAFLKSLTGQPIPAELGMDTSAK